MKLKSCFITQDIDDTQFLVPISAEAFSGIVRSNKTAAYLVNLLKKETTEEEIVDALYERYDAPREQIANDVREILNTLRSIHALEEDN
ncbi:MAG: PqqD family protein [Lachnospiraceae bacterium]|nr:PqqD family protein [Lachnospiraceae bacterium]